MIPPLQLYGFFPICLIEPDWVPWDYYPEQFLGPKFIFWSKKSSQWELILQLIFAKPIVSINQKHTHLWRYFIVISGINR